MSWDSETLRIPVTAYAQTLWAISKMRLGFIIIGLLLTFQVSGQKRQADGEFKETYSNGRLKSHGFYKKGKADSTWTFYFEDGKIYKTGNYKDCIYDLGYVKIELLGIGHDWNERGIENGTWKIYHPNGILKTEYQTICGIKTGLVKVFDDKDRLKTESFYSNGELQFEREFFDTGVVSKYSTFNYYTIKDGKNYLKHFKTNVSVFYDTGELEELYQEDNFEFHGEYKKFWKNGYIQYEATYENGYKEGIEREYYDNGLRKSETEYKEGAKHGQSFLYSREGKIIKKQNWDEGVLKKEQ